MAQDVELHFTRLLAADGAEFLRLIRPTLEAIEGSPAAGLLTRLRDGVAEIDRAFNQHDEAQVRVLEQIRRDMIRLAPEIDDTGLPLPDGPGAGQWFSTLAAFDAIISGKVRGWPVNDEDPSRTVYLLPILRNKLIKLRWPSSNPEQLDDCRPDLRPLSERVATVEENHLHELRKLKDAQHTHPGVALLGLENFVARLNPAPSGSTQDLIVRMNRSARDVLGGITDLRRILYDGATGSVDRWVEVFKPLARRVFDGLQLMSASPTANGPYTEVARAATTRPSAELRLDEPVDFLIITALEEERDAVLSKFPRIVKLDKDGADTHTYYRGEVQTGRADGAVYSVVVTSMSGMGPVRAASKAGAVVSRWHPRHVLVVGICGGVSGEVALGDVVVADQVADYSLGKALPNGNWEARWRTFPVDANLFDSACNNRMGWDELIRADRPGEGRPARRVGVVASGGDVVADAKLIAQFKAHWPKLIGVEMEGGGVAAALHETTERPPFLMIRGVSDIADAEDNAGAKSRWRAYAADVAAAYAYGFLREGPVPKRAAISANDGRSLSRSIAWPVAFVVVVLLVALVAVIAMRPAPADGPSRESSVAPTSFGTPLTPLNSQQLALLRGLLGAQERLGVNKLVVSRDGRVSLPADRPVPTNIDVAASLFGSLSPDDCRVEFSALMESIPGEYLRTFAELRLDSPFVVSVTTAGVAVATPDASAEPQLTSSRRENAVGADGSPTKGDSRGSRECGNQLSGVGWANHLLSVDQPALQVSYVLAGPGEQQSFTAQAPLDARRAAVLARLEEALVPRADIPRTRNIGGVSVPVKVGPPYYLNRGICGPLMNVSHEQIRINVAVEFAGQSMREVFVTTLTGDDSDLVRELDEVAWQAMQRDAQARLDSGSVVKGSLPR